MHRLAAAAAVLMGLALAGCGDDEPASDPASGYGGNGFNKNAGRDAFRDSKELCGTFSIEQVPREYGGDPQNPLSVASAYAEQAYVGRFQAAAREGCLVGLEGP